MKQVQWDDKYNIGIKQIDEQHKMWIQRLNEMAEAVQKNLGTQKVAKTLQFLIEYTEFHFSAEEKYMTETNFPGLEEQLAEHKKFKKILADMELEFKEDGATYVLSDSIDTLLGSWLVNHITSKDIQFAKFLSDNNLEIK